MKFRPRLENLDRRVLPDATQPVLLRPPSDATVSTPPVGALPESFGASPGFNVQPQGPIPYPGGNRPPFDPSRYQTQGQASAAYNHLVQANAQLESMIYGKTIELGLARAAFEARSTEVDALNKQLAELGPNDPARRILGPRINTLLNEMKAISDRMDVIAKDIIALRQQITYNQWYMLMLRTLYPNMVQEV